MISSDRTKLDGGTLIGLWRCFGVSGFSSAWTDGGLVEVVTGCGCYSRQDSHYGTA